MGVLLQSRCFPGVVKSKDKNASLAVGLLQFSEKCEQTHCCKVSALSLKKEEADISSIPQGWSKWWRVIKVGHKNRRSHLIMHLRETNGESRKKKRVLPRGTA